MIKHGKTWPFDQLYVADLSLTASVDGGLSAKGTMVYSNGKDTFGTCPLVHNPALGIENLSDSTVSLIKAALNGVEKDFRKMVLGEVSDPKADGDKDDGTTRTGLGGSV